MLLKMSYISYSSLTFRSNCQSQKRRERFSKRDYIYLRIAEYCNRNTHAIANSEQTQKGKFFCLKWIYLKAERKTERDLSLQIPAIAVGGPGLSEESVHSCKCPGSHHLLPIRAHISRKLDWAWRWDLSQEL